MENVLISVVMSVYNEQLYIEEAINSILNQTIQNIEVIIIDDCSTDNTVDIIKAIDDSRIHLYENTLNRGLTKNLNYALGLCHGRYIARMDGDDICLPNRFQKQVEFMDKHPNIKLISCNTRSFGSKDLVSDVTGDSEQLKCKMILRPQLAHPGFMMRAELVTKQGYLYDEEYLSAQDYDFAYRVSRDYDIGVTKEVLLKYRVHEGQVSNIPSFKQKKYANEVRKRIFSSLGCVLNETEQDAYDKWVYELKPNETELKVCMDLLDRILGANSVIKLYDADILESILWRQYYRWIIRTQSLDMVQKLFGYSIPKYFGLIREICSMGLSKVRRSRKIIE